MRVRQRARLAALRLGTGVRALARVHERSLQVVVYFLFVSRRRLQVALQLHQMSEQR